MMKTRQHRAQILSFTDGDHQEWSAFIKKNATLLQSFILHFSAPIDTGMQELCQSYGLLYTIGTLPSKPSLESIQALNSTPPKQEAKIEEAKISQSSPQKQSHTLIHKIRSGEEMTLDDNAIILGDIAHGANIYAKQSVVIFGDCAGVLRVDGGFFIVRNLTSGHIVFCDSILPEAIVAKINANSHLKIIIKNSDTIAVKEIL
ncbi:Probable septum site-determining protein minC [Helicobacter canis]|uniref:Probable septum site-determining protein minC n=2 Tax=Helicobacter canis TaxID=29419 RepID=A0A377J625_9HELI|nr:Probable septum site-determining protein minC [Helicobacter canis]